MHLCMYLFKLNSTHLDIKYCQIGSVLLMRKALGSNPSGSMHMLLRCTGTRACADGRAGGRACVCVCVVCVASVPRMRARPSDSKHYVRVAGGANPLFVVGFV